MTASSRPAASAARRGASAGVNSPQPRGGHVLEGAAESLLARLIPRAYPSRSGCPRQLCDRRLVLTSTSRVRVREFAQHGTSCARICGDALRDNDRGEYRCRPADERRCAQSIRLPDETRWSRAKAHVAANLRVGNDCVRLTDVATQLLPFIGYPRALHPIVGLAADLEALDERELVFASRPACRSIRTPQNSKSRRLSRSAIR